MKTNQLINTLSTKEVQNFSKNVLNIHKRKTLQTLFDTLKKDPKIDKKVLFKKIFEQPYSTSKDSLLRNEFRLLNQEIESYLVIAKRQKEFNIKDWDTQLDLLRIYLTRQADDLFHPLWRKLYKKATTAHLYDIKTTLVQLLFDYQTQHAPIDFDIYQAVYALLTDSLQDTLAHLQEQYHRTALHQAFLSRTLTALHPSFEPAPTIKHYQVNQVLENDAVITYLQCVIKGYSLNGEAKIKVLLEALEKAEALHSSPNYADLLEELPLVKARIGLEYFLLKQYQKADKIYRPIIETNAVVSHKRTGLYYNYFVNIICLGDYQRALDWYEQSDEEWKQSPLVSHRIKYLLCWCYILQQQYQKPLELLLSETIEEQPENDVLYAKIMLSIVYYHTGDNELTERQLYNLNQNNRYASPIETVYITYGQLFYRFLLALQAINTAQRNSRVGQIKKDLEKFYASKEGATASFLYYRWLSQQCDMALL